jgi:HAE1 family hydrophobic/amphiphilic exporter-1
MLSGVIVVLGAISLAKLPVDLMPEITNPTLSIRVGYSGVGPLEIEQSVTRPIEQSVAAVAGLQQINSSSSEGSSNVRLNFAWGTDLNEAADEVRNRLDRVRGRLPEDADAPVIFKFDSTTTPIMNIGVEGDFDAVTLRELAQNQLSPRLERVAGVAAVDVMGGLRRQIRVDLSKEKITALDLPVDRVVTVLRTENQNIPIGEIDQADTTYLLRSQGEFTNLEEIRNLVVLTKGGVPVYLKDIAHVYDGTEDERSLLRINGKPGVRMNVTKQSGQNTVAVAEAVRAEIARVNQEVPGVHLTILSDSAVYIERSIGAVQEAVLIGAVLVVAIIFLFLRNIRSTLIICTSIPISIIGTFALLHAAGFTLNTMTFGGLALGVGMIVDASIVVLENTFRHMEAGEPREVAAVKGSEEVWSAIVASILTHIAVFVPLLFLSGISSIMFKQLAVVVMFSLAMSLFVAVTLVPVLCAKLLKLPPPADQRRGLLGRLFTRSERALDGLDSGYRALIHRALLHRPTVLIGGAATFAAALALLPLIPVEMMPQTDEGQVSVTAEMSVGTRIERMHDVLLAMEKRIPELVPEHTTVVVSAGAGGMFGGGGSFRGNISVNLVPKTERERSSDQIAQALRRQLAGVPGVVVMARASSANFNMARMFGGGGGDSRLSLEIRGYDLADARRLSQEAKSLMQETPGIADAQVGRDEGRPELAVRVDRPKAALLGMSVTSVANTLRTNIAGTQAAFYRERGFEYPIVVRLREEDRERIDDVDSLLLSTPGGQVVQAKNLVSLDSERGPVAIDRKNQERLTRVNAEVETALSEAVKNVRARLPQLNTPKDFSVGFGAEVEEQARAFGQLQLVLILAVFLTYAVMAAQYESLRDPFIIMFSVPLAAIGVVGILLLTRTTFSLQAYIGVIMLAGIVVSNAILLVDYTNTLRRRDGVPLREAVERAGRTRLRPILMTTGTTVLGLVPMALGFGEGAELQAPLARVVIGGLLTSTLVTLVFVPAMYTLFEEGWGGLKKGIRHDSVS